MKKKIGVFIPATLGMLTAFGPLVTDFYLPVLPEMSEFFHTSPALASLSLTTGMIGLAAGQVFIGPLTGAGGIVISKSMSMDMFSGKELANFMAILGSINGNAPVCAPVIGGLMAGFTSWQGVFGLLLASAIFGTSGFVAGAISSPIVTMGTIEITSSIIMVLGALLCLLLTLPLCKRLRKKR